MTRQIYVNIPVRDLASSKAFFTKLGFEFNPQFTDDKAACMIVNEHAFFMLLTEPFFKTFTRQELCDTSKQTEALFAISAADRGAVDTMVKTAVAAGGRHALDPQDHEIMYSWSFYDLDGHHWEVLAMAPAAS